MPIEGLLGLRVNRWHKKDNGLLLKSPSWRDFEWDEAIAWSICNNNFCPKDDDDHVIPTEECSCGMYATISRRILSYYAKSARDVVFLCEAMGDGIAYTRGWRSSGALAVAVVNTAFLTWKIKQMEELEDGSKTRKVTNYHLSMFAASEHFGVPIIEWDVAVEMMQIQWNKHGLIWPAGKEY